MKTRIVTLFIVLLTGLSATWLLPKQGDLKPSAISQTAPPTLKEWIGIAQQPSQKELNTLARDTKFTKMNYHKSLSGLPLGSTSAKDMLRVHMSMVFSGNDVNNSIHRPERCLPAQGHYSMTGHYQTIDLPSIGKTLPIKRLTSKQKLQLSDGNVAVINSLTYYFFVGHTHLTNDHLDRTFVDMRHRILRGYDQSWAFVTLSIPYGEHPIFPELPEKEADQVLTEMIQDLATNSIDWNLIEN